MGAGKQVLKGAPEAATKVGKWLGGVMDEVTDGARKLSDDPIRDQFNLVRYDPPRGRPDNLKGRLGKRTGDRMMALAEKGIEKDGHLWYDTSGIQRQFIDELGPVQGMHDFGRYMDYVAATSPKSKVDANIRRSSLMYNREKQGLSNHGLTNKDMPPGYGHLGHETQQHLINDLSSGRHFEELTRPKASSFAENLKGNLMPVTVDTHNMRSIMNNPKYSTSATKTQYRYIEEFEQELAARMGIDPAQFQSAVWTADDTGVANVKNFNEMFDEAVVRTAARNEIPKEEALARFIRGDIPLYSLLAGTTLAQFLPQDAEAGAFTAAPEAVKAFGKTLSGVHFNRASGDTLRHLDGTKFGTGIRSAEAARLKGKDTPESIKARTYFYPDGGPAGNRGGQIKGGNAMVSPESGLGGSANRVKVSGMYDMVEDPMGFIRDQGLDGNNLEEAIKNAGFSGYYNKNQNIAIALQDTTEAGRIGRDPRSAEMNMQSAARLPDSPTVITAENIPSTDTPMGKWLSGQPMDVRERYSDGVEEIFESKNFMRDMGIDDYQVTPGYGAYEGGINPNSIIAVPNAEQAELVARTRGGLTSQEYTPFFEAMAETYPGGMGAMRVTLDNGIDPQVLKRIYDDTGMDFTRSEIDVMDFINYTDENGKPFSEMNDMEFSDRLADYFSKVEGVENVARFKAESNYLDTRGGWPEASGAVSGHDQASYTVNDIQRRILSYNDAYRKQHGSADPRALALAAGITGGGLAAGIAASEARAEQSRSQASEAFSFLGQQVEMPVAKFSAMRQEKSQFWKDRRQDLVDLVESVSNSATVDTLDWATQPVRDYMSTPSAQKALGMVGDTAVRMIDTPLQGYMGMAGMAGDLMAGRGMDQAVNTGARVAQQPPEQTTYNLGGTAVDELSRRGVDPRVAAGIGALIHGGLLMGAPL